MEPQRTANLLALNASDHLVLAASLENALYNHIDELRLNVPSAYRSNSLGIGVASNLECMSTVIGIPGKGKAQVGLLPWACHNLWLIYRHKMDDNVLRDKLFPLLKGAVTIICTSWKKAKMANCISPKPIHRNTMP